ncbi:hypothetical protein [Ornithinibacillus halophilus]|uniref:Helix-turn-helix domain-containing protein n=1 Tax=Ornithinibacillus halophilus TaxID=930117 RepID=A0A1M5GLZ3_9BACI|nr:hypothetical protein [Ornithinibacillus halophilus]SHG04744.1 hypothetical protein SAMN05216225_101367 [Ornithinibacillus halophilus]
MQSTKYYREVIAFYYANERDPLPTSSIALWHALLFINSNANWADDFTVSGPVLRLKAGLPLASFKRARRILIEKEYIEYQSRGNLPGFYRMKRLSRLDDGGTCQECLTGESRRGRLMEVMDKEKASLEKKARELKISNDETD